MLVKIGYVFKHLSWAITKDSCQVPGFGVNFLSQRNCSLAILIALVSDFFFFSQLLFLFFTY